MQLYQPTITGSLEVSGSVSVSGSITIAGGGSIAGTASIATNALTASSADNFLTRGTLTAQTIVVQTITSSIDFVTGSTQFGSRNTDTHTYTGSLAISGSATTALAVNTNALFVSSSGNVGIGVTNPSQRLEVSGAGLFTGTLSGNTKTGVYIYDQNIQSLAGAAARDLTIAGQNLILQTGLTYTTAMYISASGNIGIGTNNPNRLFYVYASTSTTTPLLKFENVGTGDSVSEYRINGYSWYVGIDNSDTGSFKIGQDPLGTSDRLTIKDGGNVGIGTTNPAQRLEVNRTGASNYLVVRGDNSASYDIAQLFTDGTNNVYTGMMRGSTGRTGAFTIWTGGAERASVTSKGTLKLNERTACSFTSNPGNVAASGTTTLTISQQSGEFQSTYLVSIVGLYTIGGANQNGFYTGLVTFFTDGANAQANITGLHNNGWTASASATTGGTFTVTFTNTTPYSMTNIAIRALKINMTGTD